MWACLKCGCRAIAESLGFCPQCFKPKEDKVPKATTGGASNASAKPGEPGYVKPESPKPKADDARKDKDTDGPETTAEPPAKAEDPAPEPKQDKPAAPASEPPAPRFAPIVDTSAKDS